MSNRIDGTSTSHVDHTQHTDHTASTESAKAQETEESSFWGAVDDLSESASAFKDGVIEGAKKAKDTVSHEVAQVEEKAKEVVDRAERDIDNFVEETKQDLEETKAGFDTAVGIAKEMAEDLEVVKDARELVDTAKELHAEGEKFVDEVGDEVRAELKTKAAEVSEEAGEFADGVGEQLADSGERLGKAKEELFERAEQVVQKALDKPREHAGDSVREFSGAFSSVKEGLDDIVEGRGFESGLQKVGRGLDLGIEGVDSTSEGLSMLLGAREETFDRLESVAKHGALELVAEGAVIGAKTGQEGYELMNDILSVLGEPPADFTGFPIERQKEFEAIADQVGGPLRTLVATQELADASEKFMVDELLGNPDGIRETIMRASPLDRADYIRTMEPGDKETTSAKVGGSLHEGVGGEISVSEKLEIERKPDVGDDQVVTVTMSAELAVAVGIGVEAMGEGAKLDLQGGPGAAIEFTFKDPNAVEMAADWVERGAKLERLLTDGKAKPSAYSGEQSLGLATDILGATVANNVKIAPRVEGLDTGDAKFAPTLSYTHSGGFKQGVGVVQLPASSGLNDASDRVDFIVNEHPDSLPAELINLVGRENAEAVMATHDGRLNVDFGVEAEVQAQPVFDVSERRLEKFSIQVKGSFKAGNEKWDASATLSLDDPDAAFEALGIEPQMLVADLNEGRMTVAQLRAKLDVAGLGDTISVSSSVTQTSSDTALINAKGAEFENSRTSTKSIHETKPKTLTDLTGAMLRG